MSDMTECTMYRSVSVVCTEDNGYNGHSVSGCYDGHSVCVYSVYTGYSIYNGYSVCNVYVVCNEDNVYRVFNGTSV